MKPDAVVTVSFFPMEMGGRRQSTPPDFFGCLMNIEGSMYDCRLVLTDVGAIAPGDTLDVPVKFLNYKSVELVLKPNIEFKLYDGKPVASGVVKYICRDQ